jgi:hypothetical protein
MVSSEGAFGGIIVDTAAGGTVQKDQLTFYSIQQAARLSTGEICTCIVNVLGSLDIYTWNSSATAPVFTLAGAFAGGNVLPGYGLNINDDKFWGLLSLNVANASFYKFSKTGVIITTVGPVVGVGTGAIFCVNILETIGYYANNSTKKIKRWDLSLNSAMADLVTFNSNYFVSGMWNVQGSTDIVVAYNNWSGPGDNTRVLIRYDSTGATVYTSTYHTIPAPFEDDFSEVALGVDLLGMWTRDAGPPSYDMTVDNEYNHVLFSDGSVDATANIAVTVNGCPDTTCFLMELASTTGDRSGIYIIVPGKTYDELFSGTNGATTLSTKIPDPTVKMFPLGE